MSLVVAQPIRPTRATPRALIGMLKCTLLLGLPVVAAAQPTTEREQWPAAVSFSAEQIIERSGSICFTNSSQTPQTWVASISSDVSTTASIQLLPIAPQTIGPGESFSYAIVPISNAVVGTYTLTVRRADKSGTKPSGVTTLNVVNLGFRPVGLSGNSGPKYVFEASRDYPFTPWKLASGSIYFTPPPRSPIEREAAQRYLASWRGRIIGILAGGPSAAADNIGAVLMCANGEDGPADHMLVDLAETNNFQSGRLIGKANVPGGAVDVTVQTRDHLLWPLLVSALGVWLAFYVSNFSARGRILAVLRTELLDLDRNVTTANDEFRKLAGFSRYDILPGWRAFEADFQARLVRLRLRAAPLDSTNTEFADANTDLKNRRQLPADLLDFGHRLQRLQGLSSIIRGLTPPGNLNSPPQMLSRLQRILGGAPLNNLTDFDSKLTDSKAAVADTELWVDSFQRLGSLRSATTDATIQAEIDGQRGRLWTGVDSALIQDVAAKARGIADRIGAAAGAPAREQAPPGAPGPPVPSFALTVVQRGDLVSATVAIAIGIVVALNTVYFAGPFGSIGDYFKVIAAALTTKIGVDIAAAAFNRIPDSPRTIGGQTVTRA
jgi:hypothetical protein